MSENTTLDGLVAALQSLEQTWELRAADAGATSQKYRFGDSNQAYYRGLAEGYKAALKDLRALLSPPAETMPTVTTESYPPVNTDRVLAVLDSAGLSIIDLHAHKDNTFSAVFAPLQVLSFEERIAKLTSAADVVILDQGRLPNSNKAYIDFAFKSPPT